MSDDDLEDPLRTGQVAAVLRVSPNTVVALFERGLLEGYVLTRQRRFAVASLRRFMERRKMPTGRLDVFLERRAAEREEQKS